MRNEEVQEAPKPVELSTPGESGGDPRPIPSPVLPLLILATDDDAVCVDDLCLPAEANL